MPKTTSSNPPPAPRKRASPSATSARRQPARPEHVAPAAQSPASATRSQLVACGLLSPTGDIVGTANHRDAGLFKIIADYRTAHEEFNLFQKTRPKAADLRTEEFKALNSRYHKTIRQLRDAQPRTREGAMEYLRAVAENVPFGFGGMYEEAVRAMHYMAAWIDWDCAAGFRKCPARIKRNRRLV